MRKMLFLFIVLTSTIAFGQLGCRMSGPTNLNVNQTGVFSVSSDTAQCSECYYWSVTGPATIVGPRVNNSVSIKRTSSGNITISLVYFKNGECFECNRTLSGPLPCDLSVGIPDFEYLSYTPDGGQVKLYAAATSSNWTTTIPSSVTFSWRIEFQSGPDLNITSNGTSFYGNQLNTITPSIAVTTANRIVAAEVTVSDGICTRSYYENFPCHIPTNNALPHCGSVFRNYSTDNDNIKIHPNPTNSIINFKFNESSSYKITLFNNIGQVIIKNEDLKSTINLENYPSGIYHYIIRNDKGFNQQGKIVKE